MAKRMSFLVALKTVLSGKKNQQAIDRCEKYVVVREARRANKQLKKLQTLLASMPQEQRDQFVKEAVEAAK